MRPRMRVAVVVGLLMLSLAFAAEPHREVTDVQVGYDAKQRDVPPFREVLRKVLVTPKDQLVRDPRYDVARPHGSVFETAKMRPRVEKDVAALKDGTPIVKTILQKEVPTGNIVLESIPIFGKQGTGKSELAKTLASWVVEKHGEANVQCLIANDYRALIENLDPTKQVYVLFLDDALDSAFSRGGTDSSLRDAIKEFNKTRHRLEEAKRIYHGEAVENRGGTMDNMRYAGIIYFLVGSQSYKGLEKQFRIGVNIFKGPLEEDRQEIDQYWRGSMPDGGSFASKVIQESWAKLFSVQRRKMEMGDYAALAQSIVCLPSRGPHLLVAPRATKNYFKRVAFEAEREDQKLEQQNKLATHVASMFLAHHDPNKGDAQPHLRDFIRTHIMRISKGEVQDEVIQTKDLMELLEPANIRHILDRAKVMRAEQAKSESGFGPGEDEDHIIETVVNAWLDAGGNPTMPQRQANASLYSFIRMEYRSKRAFRERAERLLSKIMKVAIVTYAERYGEDVAMPSTPPVAPRTVRSGPQFTFDVREWLDRLPDHMVEVARRTGGNVRETKREYEKKVIAYRLNRLAGGRELSRDDVAAESMNHFGEVVTGRTISNWVNSVEQALGNIMGAEYEAWWERQLLDGWRHAGLRDAPIASVTRGGGSGHAPDLIVQYADNHVDYWSLKCFTVKQQASFRVRSLDGHPSSFRPELEAFTTGFEARQDAKHAGRADAELPPTVRLCICYREVMFQDAEFFRVFDAPASLPVSLSFHRTEVGSDSAVVWMREGGATKEENEPGRGSDEEEGEGEAEA